MRGKSLFISLLSCALTATFLAGALIGCRTVGYAEMSPTGTISRLLPPLESEIDVWSLESVLGATVTSGSVSDFGFYEGVSYANPLVQDVITLYERDMRNVAEEYGQVRGTAVCRLVDGKVGGSGFGLAYLSGLTLFIPNLFGMPFAYAKASMQLELSVLDLRGALVGRYTSDDYQKRVPVALYYGYGDDAATKVAVDVFKACMTDIKGQIELDYDRLSGALGRSGSEKSVKEGEASPASGTPPREPFLRDDW